MVSVWSRTGRSVSKRGGFLRSHSGPGWLSKGRAQSLEEAAPIQEFRKPSSAPRNFWSPLHAPALGSRASGASPNSERMGLLKTQKSNLETVVAYVVAGSVSPLKFH